MKNNDGNTERVKRQITEALEKIQQEKLLSERECLSLKEQINGLPIEKELKVQEEKTLGLEELLQEFQDYAKQSSSKLENMLSIISSGCIPNKEERDAFEEILDKMSKQYNQVYELAKAGSQFIIATHSPILISYRDGIVYNLNDKFVNPLFS